MVPAAVSNNIASIFDSSFSLGLATESEVDDRTYWAYPFTLLGDDDQVIIFGRMQNPAGLGDPVHMMFSSDAGVSFTLMENSFGDDHIGAVTDDQFGYLYAVRNIDSLPPKLYQGVAGGTLSLLSTISINGGVNPQALRFDFNSNILAGVDTGNAIMVVYSPPSYVSWFDITSNHGVAAGINSIIVL